MNKMSSDPHLDAFPDPGELPERAVGPPDRRRFEGGPVIVGERTCRPLSCCSRDLASVTMLACVCGLRSISMQLHAVRGAEVGDEARLLLAPAGRYVDREARCRPCRLDLLRDPARRHGAGRSVERLYRPGLVREAHVARRARAGAGAGVMTHQVRRAAADGRGHHQGGDDQGDRAPPSATALRAPACAGRVLPGEVGVGLRRAGYCAFEPWYDPYCAFEPPYCGGS